MKVWIVSLFAMLAAFTGSPALAAGGGIHLVASPDTVLAETAALLKGLGFLLGAHGKGIDAGRIAGWTR